VSVQADYLAYADNLKASASKRMKDPESNDDVLAEEV